MESSSRILRFRLCEGCHGKGTNERAGDVAIDSTDERCRSGSGEKDIVNRSELILTTTCNTNERLSTRKSIRSLSIRLEEQ